MEQKSKYKFSESLTQCMADVTKLLQLAEYMNDFFSPFESSLLKHNNILNTLQAKFVLHVIVDLFPEKKVQVENMQKYEFSFKSEYDSEFANQEVSAQFIFSILEWLGWEYDLLVVDNLEMETFEEYLEKEGYEDLLSVRDDVIASINQKEDALYAGDLDIYRNYKAGMVYSFLSKHEELNEIFEYYKMVMQQLSLMDIYYEQVRMATYIPQSNCILYTFQEVECDGADRQICFLDVRICTLLVFIAFYLLTEGIFKEFELQDNYS